MMDIDVLIYPLLVNSFPEYDSGEVLDIVEEFKQPRGLDEPSEFEQEVWQKYLTLKRQIGRQQAEASQPRSGGGEGVAAQGIIANWHTLLSTRD
jgi:hypothetical protein